MSESNKTPLADVTAEQVKSMGIGRKRRSTLLWLYLDLDKDVFVAEYPEMPDIDENGKAKANTTLKATSTKSVDDAAMIATHALHQIWRVCREREISVPWQKARAKPTGVELDERKIGCAY
jgi:hypothetical protein